MFSVFETCKYVLQLKFKTEQAVNVTMGIECGITGSK